MSVRTLHSVIPIIEFQKLYINTLSLPPRSPGSHHVTRVPESWNQLRTYGCHFNLPPKSWQLTCPTYPAGCLIFHVYCRVGPVLYTPVNTWNRPNTLPRPIRTYMYFANDGWAARWPYVGSEKTVKPSAKFWTARTGLTHPHAPDGDVAWSRGRRLILGWGRPSMVLTLPVQL